MIVTIVTLFYSVRLLAQSLLFRLAVVFSPRNQLPDTPSSRSRGPAG